MPPFNIRRDADAERCAQSLEALPDYRVLRRLPRIGEIWCRSSPTADFMSTMRIAVVDTETTGLDPELDRIIELAVVKMSICELNGDLLHIAPPLSWLEDPGMPLSPEIEGLTGLTDAALAGQLFDEQAIANVFAGVDVIVAHNARFDRAFMQKRFGDLGRPWACSYTEVDWPFHGLEGGKSVSSLLTAAGHFSEHAHRAGPDAWSVACLLAMQSHDRRTIAAHLIDRARQPSRRVYAHSAPYGLKDTLKAAGYRWCAANRAWWLEADPVRIAAEESWLVSLCPMISPRSKTIDWEDRHAR